MHPRRTPLLAAVLAATALTAGCTGDAGRPGGPGDTLPERPSAAPGTPVATADTDAGAGATDPASGRPELRARVSLAVTTGREVFVQPSCTPDASGQRPCWHESALPYELDPGARPVVATAARADLDAAAGAWFVDLELDGSAGMEMPAGAPGRGGTRLALTTADGDLLLLAPGGATLDGSRLRLRGLEKATAYSLVARLVTLATSPR